jgi:uncharacterized membrane protein YebE (DUF533 family)
MAASDLAPASSGLVRDAIEAGVAAKILAAWLANRRQTLMPHTLNFRALSATEVGLLIEAMVAAAQSGGPAGDGARRQAALALALVGADAEETARHAALIDVPQPLSAILAGVRAARIGAHAYASALLAIDRTSPVGQAFLAYVAAALSLPPDLARALESRYRV